jgi:hypothetical protein
MYRAINSFRPYLRVRMRAKGGGGGEQDGTEVGMDVRKVRMGRAAWEGQLQHRLQRGGKGGTEMQETKDAN